MRRIASNTKTQTDSLIAGVIGISTTLLLNGVILSSDFETNLVLHLMVVIPVTVATLLISNKYVQI
jgi:hypothetical protein